MNRNSNPLTEPTERLKTMNEEEKKAALKEETQFIGGCAQIGCILMVLFIVGIPLLTWILNAIGTARYS